MAGAIAVVVAALVPFSAVQASSPSPGPRTPRSLAVSVPADAVRLSPGETSPIRIRVLNPGSTPVTVTVKGEGVILGDNGTTRFTGAADPQWAGHTDFPRGDLTVPAQGYIDVPITVHMPASISPDLYYIGFLVTPVASASGNVVVINQLGAFFVIDVPGARVRKLTADLDVPGFNWGPIHLGGLLIGERVVGELTAHNVGPSSVQFFGENDATSSPFGGTPSQQRIGKSLLPIGRSRSFQVSAQPGFLIDMVTMTVTLTYPDQVESATKQIVLTNTMLVISPWLIVAVCVLIALVVCWRLYARHRRRSRRRAIRQLDRPSAQRA